MKKKIAAIVIFISVLVLPMAFWPLIEYVDNTEIYENRSLSQYPDKFDNEYFQNFDKYFLDHLPLRKPIIKAYMAVDRLFTKGYYNLLGSMDRYIEQNNVIFGQDDWLFYSADNSLAYYRGVNLPADEEMAAYVRRAEIVNDYFKSVNKRFVIMIMPNKEQIYSEYMPTGIKILSQQKRMDMVAEYFADNSNVKLVYPKQSLLQEKNNRQVYYKQDTHWTKAGAFVGTAELLDVLGIPRSQAVLTPISITKADLAQMIAKNPITDLDYNVDYRSEISAIVTYADDIYTCVSSNSNGRKLVFLGDSFRENMIEILDKEFTQCIFPHRVRQFNQNNNYFKNEINNADVVVFQAVERYETEIFGNGGLLDQFIEAYGLR